MSGITPLLPQGAPVLLDTRQAAAVLGFQPTTLEEMRRRGGGPPYVRLSARAVRYPLEKLEAWLEERTASSTAEERARQEREAVEGCARQPAGPRRT